MNDFGERDTTVIPWLPQYSRPSPMTPERQCKIISLLSARERIGLKSNCTRVGSLTEGILVSNEELSAAGAWNRRRMQNMILAVGPGTPASCVLTSVSTENDVAGAHSDSNDEDDIYHADTDDEDDVEMLESEEEDLDESHGEEIEEDEVDNDDDSELEIVAGSTAEDQTEDRSSTESQDDRLEAEAEIARHLAARPIEEEHAEQQDDMHHGRSAWTRRQNSYNNMATGEGRGSEDGSQHTNSCPPSQNDSTSDSDSEHNASNLRADQVFDFIEQQIRRHQRRRQRTQLSSQPSDHDTSQPSQQYEREVARSMKHGGCINTASWLDCGWRISTASHEDAHPYDMFYNEGLFRSSSYSANESCYSTPVRNKQSRNDGLAFTTYPSEYPTQLLTSGDDHLVKFWDVSQSMGSTSPLPGGSATVSPFCSPRVPMKPTSELLTTWRHHVHPTDIDNCTDPSDRRHKRHLPGIVHPLLTLSTGHRGNVFHVTPVPNTPGKVLTCAADGFVRLTDVEINATSSPAGRSRGRSNSTSSTSIAGEASTIIISPEYHNENGETGPAFRFRDSLMCFSHNFLSSNVGLVCSERGLLHFDLRLSPNSQKRGSLIEELSTTCKSCCVWRDYNVDSDSAYVFAGGSGTDVGLYDLRMTGRSSSQIVQRYRPRPLRRKSSVSISGIEVSRNNKELLVAYESDQCYTFPIFPGTPAGPTISDISISTEDTKNGARPVSELAQYGGHLNRLTFLKSAKYAGPNDEYICTGSDSGHAWIYEKRTGAVAAFLRADHSTCNGILPHPSLPYFITYGIDSTVKLWRATIPVAADVDDSDAGRFAFSQREEYSKSIIVDKWKDARKRNTVDLDDDDIPFFPDETPIEDVMEDSISLGFMGIIFSRTRTASSPPFIGNDLRMLNKEIAKNYYTCARSGAGDDIAVKSGLDGMKRRMSMIKLQHHADRLGLNWDANVPWNVSFKERHKQKALAKEEHSLSRDLVNLIPDPSDWIPFHRLMSAPPLDCGIQFSKRHRQFYYESTTNIADHPVKRAAMSDSKSLNIVSQSTLKPTGIKHSDEDIELLAYNSTRPWDILYATVSLLKEAGNTALQNSLTSLAANFYDKALTYCALVYMQFPVGNCNFLASHQLALSENSGWECRWTAMLKTFLQIRLNMALCCLKNDLNDPKAAMFQSKRVLKELRPFVVKKGLVLTGKKLDRSRLEEPDSTYTEATALQSKAYFRLGVAQLHQSDFEDAIESFEQSIQLSNSSCPEKKPDSAVLRKLQEAKLEHRKQCNRERKKFKFAFTSKNGEQSNEE